MDGNRFTNIELIAESHATDFGFGEAFLEPPYFSIRFFLASTNYTSMMDSVFEEDHSGLDLDHGMK